MLFGFVTGLVCGIVFRKPIGNAIEASLKWVQEHMRKT